MQNTNIVYHPESVIEMQIMCLGIIFLYVNRIYILDPDSIERSSYSANFIMFALMAEHIFSCCCAFYRSYDIDKNGKIDINGVKRAPNELLIGNVQFFISCIIIGFAVNHFLRDDSKQNFHNPDFVLQNYWIIIDIFIVFLAQVFISISLYMKVSGEVVKNLYSLHFLQQILMQKKIINDALTAGILKQIMKKFTRPKNETKIVVDKFKGTNPPQTKNIYLNRNLGGAKVDKIIDEYSNI